MKTNTILLAAIGARGTDATFANVDFETLKAQVGGTVRAYSLDKTTVILYDSDCQATMFLNEDNLSGTLALVGVDSSNTPVSVTVKQVTKFGKVFKATRAVKTETEPRKEV